MTLAARLRRLLDERGLTVSEVARDAAMEKVQLWRIVAGRNANPGVATVERIVEAAGASMADLFADEE